MSLLREGQDKTKVRSCKVGEDKRYARQQVGGKEPRQERLNMRVGDLRNSRREEVRSTSAQYRTQENGRRVAQSHIKPYGIRLQVPAPLSQKQKDKKLNRRVVALQNRST
jgi:hypothetical protein